MVPIYGYLPSLLMDFLIMIFGLLFGSLFIYKSKKLNIKILLYAGLSLFFYGFVNILGVYNILSFFFTGVGINIIVYVLNSIIFFGASVLLIIYVAGELLFPKKKWLILSIFLIGGSLAAPIFLIIIIINPMVLFSPIIYFIYTYTISLEFSIALLFFIKSIQYHRELKKKFIFLSLAYFSLAIGLLLDAFLDFLDIQIYIGMVLNSSSRLVFIWFFYYSLKPGKSIKPKKLPSQEEVKLTSYMSGKPIPAEIAEEELKQEISRIQVEKTTKRPIYIFMSYATRDAENFKISEISESLTVYDEIKDVLYWQEDLHDNIIEYMNENLKKCDVLILFCSENALNSVPVKKEWTAAEIMGIPIIPVFTNYDHIPPILKSRLGYELDLYDVQTNVQELYDLALKKCKVYYKFEEHK